MTIKGHAFILEANQWVDLRWSRARPFADQLPRPHAYQIRKLADTDIKEVKMDKTINLNIYTEIIQQKSTYRQHKCILDTTDKLLYNLLYITPTACNLVFDKCQSKWIKIKQSRHNISGHQWPKTPRWPVMRNCLLLWGSLLFTIYTKYSKCHIRQSKISNIQIEVQCP